VKALGIDIDGCLADFNSGFRQLILEETGKALPAVSDSYPDTWDWPAAGGLSDGEIQRCLDRAHEPGSSFWFALQPLRFACEALGELSRRHHDGHAIYFITNRQGHRVKQQTESWLYRFGMDRPTVLVASRKGSIARDLRLTGFVDDKLENVEDVRKKSPKTSVVLVDAPWNRSREVYGVRRAKSVFSALEVL
jgi:hypothetical protein